MTCRNSSSAAARMSGRAAEVTEMRPSGVHSRKPPVKKTETPIKISPRLSTSATRAHSGRFGTADSDICGLSVEVPDITMGLVDHVPTRRERHRLHAQCGGLRWRD